MQIFATPMCLTTELEVGHIANPAVFKMVSSEVKFYDKLKALGLARAKYLGVFSDKTPDRAPAYSLED